MQGKGLVFVTGDRLGDQLTALLEEAGCQVIRGPQPRPPALTIFPQEEWPRWFSETDVMVVSPRDVCSREVMLAAPRLRAVVSTVIGVDTIDLDAANDLGLIVGHGAMPVNRMRNVIPSFPLSRGENTLCVHCLLWRSNHSSMRPELSMHNVTFLVFLTQRKLASMLTRGT